MRAHVNLCSLERPYSAIIVSTDLGLVPFIKSLMDFMPCSDRDLKDSVELLGSTEGS